MAEPSSPRGLMAAILNGTEPAMHTPDSSALAHQARLDRDSRRRLRIRLVSRGEELSVALAASVIGKLDEATLLALGVGQPTDMPAEDALRAALDQVDRRRFLLDGNDDRYGRCDVCGVDLGLAVLGEMPWLDRCAKHP